MSYRSPGRFSMTDFVSILYGHRGGNSCHRPAKGRLSTRLSPAKPTRKLSLPTLRLTLRNRQGRVGRAIRAPVRVLARPLGFRRGHLPRLRFVRIRFRSRQVPELQIRVPRRFLMQVSGTLSVLWREASRDFRRVAPTQDSRGCASRSMGVLDPENVETIFFVPSRASR